jgi:hypothetical protein
MQLSGEYLRNQNEQEITTKEHAIKISWWSLLEPSLQIPLDAV